LADKSCQNTALIHAARRKDYVYDRIDCSGWHRYGRLRQSIFTLGAVALIIVAVWILGLSVFPGLFQWLRVEPNEITFEKPYIAHNIEFTRHGFNLHNVEEREFPAAEQLKRARVENNRQIFDSIHSLLVD